MKPNEEDSQTSSIKHSNENNDKTLSTKHPNKDNGQISSTKNCNQEQFHMTVKRYQELLTHQKEFHVRLISLLNSCPQYKVIQELMVIHGQHKAPKWLRTCTRNILISKITQQDGVLSLINAICGNELDIGANWRMMDVVSKLLATSHGKDADEYYKLVCPQVCMYVCILCTL